MGDALAVLSFAAANEGAACEGRLRVPRASGAQADAALCVVSGATGA